MNKSNIGVSLIVLIITIIVIIILAGAVILSLASNNPIKEATEAKFKENVQSYQAELTLWLSKEFVSTDGMLAVKTVNATKDKGEYQQLKIQDIITNMSDKQGGYTEDATKFAIKEGVLIYIGDNTTEEEWAKEAGIGKDTIPEVEHKVVPFMVEITTKTANEKFVLPINSTAVSDSAVFDFIVDYGDGTVVSVKSMQDSNREHVYAVPGKYEISITGRCDRFSVVNELGTNGSYDLSQITKLIQWGNIQMNQLDFMKCTNLSFDILRLNETEYESKITNLNSFISSCNISSLPETLFQNAPNIIDLSFAFAHNPNITTLPENLFVNMKKIEKMSNVFQNGTGLTQVPEKLFFANTAITSFNNTFSDCTNLAQIPPNLFVNNTQVTNFSGTFYNCDKITSIPATLFINCTKVIDFNSTFLNCDKLASVPDGLFNTTKEVISFESTFGYCKALTTIPETLFYHTLKVTSFRTTFANSINLTTNPVSLFLNTPLVKSYAGTFSGCNKLTGTAPSLWNNSNVTENSMCFLNCTLLSNYNQIPNGWK